MARAFQSLEGWILEAMSDEDKDPGLPIQGSTEPPVARCYRISLMHMQGTMQNEIHSVPLDRGKVCSAKEIANLLEGRANSFSQGLPGDQTFRLLAFYGNNPNPQATHHLVVNDESDSGGIGTHGPSDKGLLGLAMQQSATSVAQANKQTQFAFGVISSMTHMLAEQNTVLRKENSDMAQIFKQMIFEKAADDNVHRMEQLKYQRSSQERKKWLSFAPVLINTLLGKELFPQSTADTALIELLAEKLSEQDISKLAGVVPPELMGPLAARAAEYLSKKRVEKEQEEQIMNLLPQTNPEDDAAGD